MSAEPDVTVKPKNVSSSASSINFKTKQATFKLMIISKSKRTQTKASFQRLKYQIIA
jgi:hypothetical protein